jgi:hypothetical protein
VRSANAVSVSRSQLMQLSSALSGAQAAAASDLNTEVKVQTLHAYLARSERLATSLGLAASKSQGIEKNPRAADILAGFGRRRSADHD